MKKTADGLLCQKVFVCYTNKNNLQRSRLFLSSFHHFLLRVALLYLLLCYSTNARHTNFISISFIYYNFGFSCCCSLLPNHLYSKIKKKHFIRNSHKIFVHLFIEALEVYSVECICILHTSINV